MNIFYSLSLLGLMFNIAVSEPLPFPQQRLQAESVLPAYLNMDEAVLAFRKTDPADISEVRVNVRFAEKSTGFVPQQPVQLDIKESRTNYPVDISSWPDGEYKVIVTEVVEEGLVAWWKFDEGSGSSIADSSSNSWPAGVVHGTAQWGVEDEGGGLHFDYTVAAEYVKFTGLDIGGGDAMSIAFWAKDDVVPDYSATQIVFWGIDSANTNRLKCYFPYSLTTNDNRYQVQFFSPDGLSDTLFYSSALAARQSRAGEWHHWVFQKDARQNTVEIYLDGALVATGAGSNDIASMVEMRIGGNSDPNNPYRGYLKDFRIYNRVLTEREIATIRGVIPDGGGPVAWWKFDEGSGSSIADSSSNSWPNGVVLGSAKWGAKEEGGGLHFDYAVAAKYVKFTGLDIGGGDAMSIAFWAKDDPVPDYSATQIMFWGIDAASVNRLKCYFPYSLTAAESRYQVQFFSPAGLSDTLFYSSTLTDRQARAAEWHHWVFQKEAQLNKTEIYLDGRLIAFGTGVNDIASMVEMRLGGNSDPNNPYRGYLKDFRIYNRALTDREIVAIREDAFNPGPMIRAIRKQTIPEPTPPLEPIQVAGIDMLFVDDWYLQEKNNLDVMVNSPEVVPFCNEAVFAEYPYYNTKLQQLYFGTNGVVTAELSARNFAADEPVVYYVESDDFEHWSIVEDPQIEEEPEPPTETETETTTDPSFRYYQESDGPVSLSEVEIRYTEMVPDQKWGEISVPFRSRLAVWKKTPEEYIILGDPITTDKWIFKENEIGEWNNSNDNFGNQTLSRDGTTLRFCQSRLIPRNDPFLVHYDNLLANRIQVTWSTTNGLNWTPTYFSVPDFDDAQELQHYDVKVFEQEGGNLQLGYLRMYNQVMQRIYTELVYSRDGVFWNRFPAKTRFLSNSEEVGGWNFGYALMGREEPWEHDGTSYQSVFGINVLHFMFLPANALMSGTSSVQLPDMTLNWLENTYWCGSRLFGPNGIEDSPVWDFYKSWDSILAGIKNTKMAPGLMRMRKSGWVSLDAGETSGQFITKALTTGSNLFINAQTEAGGFVKVEVLDMQGDELSGYCGQSAAVFSGDSVESPVVWQAGGMAALPDHPVKLRVTIQNAKLYSLGFRD